MTILKHLRAAAGPQTQLVIVEQLIACACDEPATHEISGAELPVPPKPLLPNMGRAGSMAHATDAMVSSSSADRIVGVNGCTCHRCWVSSMGKSARSRSCVTCLIRRVGSLLLCITTLRRRRGTRRPSQFLNKKAFPFNFLSDCSCFSGSVANVL